MNKTLFRKISSVESTIEFTGAFILYGNGNWILGSILLIFSLLEITMVSTIIDMYRREGFPVDE